MNKIREFIRKHKKIIIALMLPCSFLPLIIVHVLFKWRSDIDFLVAEWSAGELLGYIGTLMSFWGTIVYGDNSEKQKLFYPDYIVGVNGEIWIIETKGGFDRSGNSQDIDIYTPKKFEVLKAYLDAHRLKGGIVRNDATTDELCICMEHYSDDIGSDDWALLEDIFG